MFRGNIKLNYAYENTENAKNQFNTVIEFDKDLTEVSMSEYTNTDDLTRLIKEHYKKKREDERKPGIHIDRQNIMLADKDKDIIPKKTPFRNIPDFFEGKLEVYVMIYNNGPSENVFKILKDNIRSLVDKTSEPDSIDKQDRISDYKRKINKYFDYLN
jgi:hypothetical protein